MKHHNENNQSTGHFRFKLDVNYLVVQRKAAIVRCRNGNNEMKTGFSQVDRTYNGDPDVVQFITRTKYYYTRWQKRHFASRRYRHWNWQTSKMSAPSTVPELFCWYPGYIIWITVTRKWDKTFPCGFLQFSNICRNRRIVGRATATRRKNKKKHIRVHEQGTKTQRSFCLWFAAAAGILSNVCNEHLLKSHLLFSLQSVKSYYIKPDQAKYWSKVTIVHKFWSIVQNEN